MLCLGPASSCDVCLDPFGADHKAPCSIECGHVFCLDCLDQLPSPTCPLCRETFNFRSSVKLHVDVDGCGAAQSSVYAEARGLQREIANVANEGTTEPRLRELISRCKTFLHSQSREMFEDLRVSHRMLAYLCEIKSKLRAQSQEVSRLDTERVHLHEEIEHLEAEKAAEIARLEAEKIDKENVILELERLNREERDRARDAELESRRKGMEMQARYIEQLEIANKLRADLDNLRNGVVRISTAGDFYQEQPKSVEAPLISVSTPPFQDERSISPEDLHPVPEQELLISPFPEFATSTLPMEFSTLPTIDDHSEEIPTVPGCGAAGCPLSCNCQSVQLFSTTSAPLDLPSPGVPSLLSLTAPRADDSPRSTSSYSPRTPSDRPVIEDLPPTCPPSPPLHSTTNYHVERLRNLLTDSSPTITASMPELVSSYREREGMQPSSSPRQSISSRSLESSTASLPTQPLPVPSVQPSSVVTTEVTTATSQPFQHRTGLSSASSAAQALERLTKERQKVERERRRAEKMDDSPADDSSRNPSRPVSGVPDIPVDSNYASSRSHSSYYSGVSADVTGSKGHHQSYHGNGMDSQRSSYSTPSTLAIRVEGRSSRPRLDTSHYSADANSSTKVESRARSSSRVQQDGTDADRSSYSNPSNLSAKMESRTSRSSSRVQQEAPINSATSGDRSSSSNPSAVTSKPESRSSRSSSKMQHHEVSQSSSKHYVPIQREGSYNYNSVSASNPSSYRDYDSALYANTPPTASHLSRQSSTSMASTQTKPAGSSAIAKDSSNSYRQYSSSSGKSKLVSTTSSLSANVGYAHA